MIPVTCRYCGLPFKVRRAAPDRDYFCCMGCAMLARVPVDASGQFPVNAHLVTALAVGFVFFNQLLFWALATLLRDDPAQARVTMRLLWFSTGAAFGVWALIGWANFREKVFRASDFAAAAIALGAHVFAFLVARPPHAAVMAVGNALLLAWSARGALRKKIHR
jgi:hypothetical protein